MADYRAHIAVSTLTGMGYGAAGLFFGEMPLPTCVLAAGLCSVAGMGPDLDSGPGVPLRESMAFAAAVIPMMLVPHFREQGMGYESIILAAAGLYLLIRFGLSELLKLYTVHRGMFHSIPAVLIAGQLAFLLASGETVGIRAFKAGGFALGYLSHLVLDEIWAVRWYRGRWHFKSSFGTALKFFGRGWWPNISAFGKLAIVTALVLMQSDVSTMLSDQARQMTGKKTETVDRVASEPAAPPAPLWR